MSMAIVEGSYVHVVLHSGLTVTGTVTWQDDEFVELAVVDMIKNRQRDILYREEIKTMEIIDTP